jgi:aryl-alcohol dehydrogenase-like predicted oxidoreductase
MSFADPLSLTRFVYGTTRLGDSSLSIESRREIAKTAIEAGLALHTSDQYGDALSVLKDVLHEGPGKRPSLIVKIGWDSVPQVREQVDKQLRALGLESMAIGQLCLSGALADDLRIGGHGIDGLNELRSSGRVGQFVLETWPWNSAIALESLKEGHAGRLVDALIFYFNPLQRFVTNDLWDWLAEHETPVIAMRTVSGGDPRGLLEPGSRAPEYLKERASEVVPLLDRSGLSWTEFCFRFVFGFSFVKATVGATSKPSNLAKFLDASKYSEPLPASIASKLVDLQRRWSDEHDRHAEPWSM